ncbi:hypothetical protein SY2F82_46610 [Streptomyces sp. Y2F8-2]|uniref:hypothetical protein n=1 Tax=Streptomyces sp. Y2F8-2 TaxID=2759675 RepID=UPI0019088C4A|nr:hypothetical protein [Streptomyces sp. Y2F8-2]GHK02864.1 hypothetical protein SY2F82_46610 [Streptomyces sp. Y2F8-2]
MALKKVEHSAPKKQVMTLDELEAFVQDARRTGATGREEVEARVSFGGKIQKLSVEVQAPPADRGPSLDKPDVAS